MMTKFNLKKYLVMVLTMTAVTLMFQNCSQHQFQEMDEASAASSGEPVVFPDPFDEEFEDDDVYADTDIAKDETLPLFDLETLNADKAGGYARYFLKFQSPVPYDFEAVLQTDDTMFLKDSRYAVPNVHYVPNKQKIKILKGATTAYIDVLTIDWDIMGTKEQYVIRVGASNCYMGGQRLSCRPLFSGISRDLN